MQVVLIHIFLNIACKQYIYQVRYRNSDLLAPCRCISVYGYFRYANYKCTSSCSWYPCFLPRPYDMIEEANIHFRYTPGRADLPTETRRRHRRYLSNILTKILGNINWQANFSTRIPFNEDENGLLQKNFVVHKSLGERSLNLTYSETGLKDDFKLRCIACQGRTDISYVL